LRPDVDEVIGRPLGTGKPKRRLFGVRQIILTVLVLGLGGGGGVAAYYLSAVDPKDIIAMLDVADPDGPKLTWLLPGAPGQEGNKAAPAPTASGLFAPPGGAPALPAPEKPPEKPLEMSPEKSIEKPGAPVPEPKSAEAKNGAAKPSAMSKLIDPKMFSNLVVPPSVATARPAPPPVPRSVDATPSYTDIAVRPAEKPLAAAPEKALLGTSAQGPVPVVSADGRQPWKVYARPLVAPETQPRVAVVITDLGLDSAATDAAISRLPAEISLAFSPYALDLPKWIKKARDAGHEALVVLPVAVDAASAPDPGPLGLKESYGDKQNIALLQMVLTRAPGVVGVVTPPASFLSGTKGAAVMSELLQRGVLYVGQAPRGLRQPPMAPVSDVIDTQPWRAAIDDHLAQAQDRAKSQPAQVLLASPRPVTLAALAPWLDGLVGQGVVVAPVSALAAPPAGK
jgi:polysaccharide deacetylase 2 family uncharacterized protein YibQ